MDKKSYDFSGWATRNDIRCSDGRTIKKDAFKDQNGKKVPLVWNHNHTDASNVLGHAWLENRDEGVYAYCSFNNTKQAENAREFVNHGDIEALSICANQLVQNKGDVIHGIIREVSLVLAGANPGAYIETVLAHGDESDEEAIIYNNFETIQINHSEESEKNKEDGENMPEEKVLNQQPTTEEIEHAEEKTVQEIFDSMNEEQKTVVYALIAQALEEGEENKMKHSEEIDMKTNVFENQNGVKETALSHSDMLGIIEDAKKCGSLKDACEQYAMAHSITGIENFFPEVKLVGDMPAMIEDKTDWVSKVMNGVKHTPFSRIKSAAANTTAEEARAKGYVKGNQKVEEVLTSLKRTTTPTTIYKLQKLDRDDVIDITDFDVVAWLKMEMRGKLDEEAARAILIGDGRSSSSDDKINPLNIRPIYQDDSTYTIAKTLVRPEDDDDNHVKFTKEFIRQVIKARKDYKGSGNPTLFCTEDLLTDMLLVEDTNGRVIYDTEEKLRTALRVKEIVTVEPMENIVRTSEGYDYKLMGIVVNLADYNVGTNKGGEVNFFDNFNLNFNKMEYLIETRFSGALVKPYSAITFEEKYAHVED